LKSPPIIAVPTPPPAKGTDTGASNTTGPAARLGPDGNKETKRKKESEETRKRHVTKSLPSIAIFFSRMFSNTTTTFFDPIRIGDETCGKRSAQTDESEIKNLLLV
jgi:hypothetical protein